MLKIWKESERAALAGVLGPELMERRSGAGHLCAALADGGVYAAVRLCDPHAPEKPRERVELIVRPAALEVLPGCPHAAACARTLAGDGSGAALALELLRRLTAEDMERLARQERDIIEFENGLITASRPVRTAGARILQLRRAQLERRRAYTELLLMLDSFAEACPLLHGEQALLHTVQRHTERLLAETEHLLECIAQAREAWQAQIGIEQNQIMKIYTVLTALFLPLTLITGWYGMNVQLAEFGWRYGALFVAALALLSGGVCILIFRRKKWF